MIELSHFDEPTPHNRECYGVKRKYQKLYSPPSTTRKNHFSIANESPTTQKSPAEPGTSKIVSFSAFQRAQERPNWTLLKIFDLISYQMDSRGRSVQKYTRTIVTK